MREQETLEFEGMGTGEIVREIQDRGKRKKVQSIFSEIATAAFHALSARVMIFYAVTLVAGAFAWALANPDAIRTITATIFACVLILAGIFKGKDDAR